jgi:cell division protein FtsW
MKRSFKPAVGNPLAGAKRLIVESGVAPVDTILAAAVVTVLGFGLVMVYSASAFDATVRFGDAQHYLKRQAVYAFGALVVMWLVSRFDYRRIRPFTYPLLLGTIGMLVATVIGLGHRAGNAYRWLAVGPVHIQPSEAAKVVLVMWLAYSMSKKGDQIKTFWVGFVPHLVMVGLLMALCLKQPDFGSAVVLFVLTMALLFIAGARLPHLIGTTTLFATAGVILIRVSEYRFGRILAWFNMDQHRQGLAYQPFQSVMSFGSGGVSGLGLGKGLQVLYLPDAHTDFIAAIIGEEMGFVGIVTLCLLYALIVARGIKVAFTAEDDYGSYIAFGISALFAVQVLLNLAVALAILPTKGLTLPFVSYGGSSLLVCAGAIGVLLNISRNTKLKKTAPQPKKDETPLPSATAVVATAADEPDAKEAA